MDSNVAFGILEIQKIIYLCGLPEQVGIKVSGRHDQSQSDIL